MPSKHRLELVAISLDNIRTVLEEREKAKNMLLHGRSEKFAGKYVNHMTSDKDEIHWERTREYPVPQDQQHDHLNEFYFAKTHPDAEIDHHYVKEYQLRKQETKFKETNEFYKMLNKKWNSYVHAHPDKNLPTEAPQWWLDLEEHQPQYRHGIWITNMPIVDEKFVERKKITQNAPGDPNI